MLRRFRERLNSPWKPTEARPWTLRYSLMGKTLEASYPRERAKTRRKILKVSLEGDNRAEKSAKSQTLPLLRWLG